ncbi:hypothetical protein [Sulfuricurvum sp.]|uniref:hypothetical protein n=1 Tax=Sulfuricurvum sp. TaxID=2025608 RepID=UPI003BAE2FD3
MKKTKKHIIENLKPMSLYLDDIEKLVEMFKEVSNELYIEFDSYELENISEIQLLNIESTNKMKLISRNPYISIEFSNNGIGLYSDDDSAIQKGCIAKIKDYLSNKNRKFTYIYHSSILSGGAIGLSLVPLIINMKNGDLSKIIFYSMLLLLALLWSFFGMRDQFRNYSIIYAKPRNASPNFLQRNKDQIIVASIGAFIGIAGTLLINYINISQSVSSSNIHDLNASIKK